MPSTLLIYYNDICSITRVSTPPTSRQSFLALTPTSAISHPIVIQLYTHNGRSVRLLVLSI